MEQLDLCVIGAGSYGLAAAKQYHVSHPDHSIVVLDAYSTLGGVWSTERIYPGLKSNNLHGTYEYPGFPMTTERFGVKPREHVPGPVIHDYLEAYAREFGIDKHIRLNTKVLSAEHQAEGGWVVETKKDGEVAATKLLVKRLVVATGQVSEPWMPHIKGQEEYGRPIFHSKYFREHKDTINTEKRVTVFGGSKCAWDAVYAYGTQGVKVDWIIRPTGHGPAWMSPPFVTPLKKWLEKLVNTRLIHWFGPCIWAQDSGYHGIKSFWHGTALGRAITNGFWNAIAADVIALMGIDKNPELAKLTPTAEAMYTGTSFSILNYDTDFFEPIRNGTVRIHEADLSHLSEGKVHLDDAEGTVLESDAFLAATGWTSLPPLKFLPEGIDRKIGVPYIPTANDEGRSPDEGLASYTDLLDKADAEIQARFPRLKVPMKFNPNYVPLTETKAFSTIASDAPLSASTTPYTTMMLYRFMVPGTAEFLRTKDLAFAGGVANFSNVICAHVQGLWISAFFDGTLARDPSSAVVVPGVDVNKKQADTAGGQAAGSSTILTLDEVHWQTVLHNRFGKWRYPRDIGARYPDFIFEAVPYLDMLMADLGLAVHRKNGWFNEITDSYGPEDYANINEEFATNLQAKQA